MVDVVALIRFSFLSSSDDGYRLAKGVSLEQKAATLFADERLRHRFRLFESICLPSLRMQPPDRFHAIILASAAMPDAWRERLLGSTRDLRNVHVVFEAPAAIPYEALWVRHIRGIGGLNDFLVTCRLDDDDALAADYTAALGAYANSRHVGQAISFPLGLQAAMVEGEPRFWESYWPLTAAGLGFVCTKERLATIFSCGHHHQIPRKLPAIVDARSARYVVTRHRHNDSLVGKVPPAPRSPRLRQSLKRVLWPAPRQVVMTHPPEARQIPEHTWSIDEAAREAPGVAAVLRGCDWSAL